ncbi:MAG: tetratricopeptide repeat protein [Desmonostoc vinosum HA7617-LM4]|nr:tetratricopeptide repeat protein [Desmonostoc vinosum HA7617-LM4]
MKFHYLLAPALMGVTVAFVQPQAAVALSSAEVAKLAKTITVLIDNQNASGTGVIIQKQGNTYTVLTARHVIETQAKYEIVTPDGQRYALNYNTVNKLPDVDLALVQFTSAQNYPTAKIGNSDESPEGTTAYVAGFPQVTAAFSTSIYNFTDGRITANATKALRDGYALVYSNNTLPGMSGGPVLNDKGELIGIHGRGDTAENFQISDNNPNVIIKSGFNLGIPINTFLRLSAKTDTDVGVKPPSTPVITKPKADNFYLQGLDKYQKADFRGAITAYTEAIRLNSKYASAYYRRGDARVNLRENEKLIIGDYQKAADLFFAQGNKADGYRSQGSVRLFLKDYQGAITALTEAIKLNRNDFAAYGERGRARSNLGDWPGAIADYTEAIRLNPNDIDSYINRGNVRRYSGDSQGAITDFQQVINLSPNSAFAYLSLGFTYNESGQSQEAIANLQKAADLFFQQGNKVEAYQSQGQIRLIKKDYQGAIALLTKVIQLNPESVHYNNRAYARLRSGDKQGAIADYTKSLQINPNDINAYSGRAFARLQSGDAKGAIADYTQSIRRNPKDANAYAGRGFARNQLGDKQGAVTDLQTAAKLFQEQGNTTAYKQILGNIRRIQE